MGEVGALARGANIQLPYVKRGGGMAIRDALSRRASSRMFDAEPFELQQLADLLWCGFGVNRANERGRTAPSARGWREIDIYVVLRDGAYRYDHALNRLDFVAAGDVRAATGVQDFVAEAPLNLVYVAEYAKMEGASPDQRDVFAAADAAFIAQNVYLFLRGRRVRHGGACADRSRSSREGAQLAARPTGRAGPKRRAA